jgi:hypothetical protein
VTICGEETITAKSDGSINKFVLPIGTGGGSVTWDLSTANDNFGY